MTRDEARAELARLADALHAANVAYHRDDAPEITDSAYDALKRRNAAIEARFPDLKRADSASDQVGAAPAEAFAKVRHRVRMLSLANAFSAEDIRDFDRSIRSYLGLSEAETADLHGRAEDRRAVAVAALRGRAAGAGGHPWRWQRRRERHRKCAHGRRNSPSGLMARPRHWRCAARST